MEEKTAKSWKDRVAEELIALAEKREKLYAFCQTEEFKGLAGVQKELLLNQLSIQDLYISTLRMRIAFDNVAQEKK